MRTLFAITILFALLTSYGCVSQKGDGNTPPAIVGNDSDAHGCKASAGYSWCDLKQKCLRVWEENCTGATLPRACTEEARICPDGSAVGRQGPNCEFSPCPPANYTLYGKVTIDPLCPVEPCSNTFDYGGVRVNVYDAASKNMVAQISAVSSGYYGVKLEEGSYLVNVTDSAGNSFGLPRLDYTQSIAIEKGHEIQMDFDIDTGIRTPGQTFSSAPLIIYKPEYEYYANFVTAGLHNETELGCFPGITDVNGQEPIRLHNGYLISRMCGAGEVGGVVLNMTISDYSQLQTQPSAYELFNSILNRNPFVESYNCASVVGNFKNGTDNELMDGINRIIDGNGLDVFCERKI